jgi:hypothetical protein
VAACALAAKSASRAIQIGRWQGIAGSRGNSGDYVR